VESAVIAAGAKLLPLQVDRGGVFLECDAEDPSNP